MKKLLITSLAAAALLASPAMEGTAAASAKSCVKSLGKLAKKSWQLKGAIRSAKKACEELRDCKTNCKTEKTCKSIVAGEVQRSESRSACRKLYKAKGKAGRKTIKSYIKTCKRGCRVRYKTPECREARWAIVEQSVEAFGGLVAIAGECAPFPGLECLSAVGKCAKTGTELGKAISDEAAKVKTACSALRTCKKESRESKNDCISECKTAGGMKKYKKECKKGCRAGKKDDILKCREKFKDEGCKSARKALWAKIESLAWQEGKKGSQTRKCLSALLSCKPM
jgi:hypothetical protein